MIGKYEWRLNETRQETVEVKEYKNMLSATPINLLEISNFIPDKFFKKLDPCQNSI